MRPGAAPSSGAAAANTNTNTKWLRSGRHTDRSASWAGRKGRCPTPAPGPGPGVGAGAGAGAGPATGADGRIPGPGESYARSRPTALTEV
ncbi:hypothetical protein GCM10009654_09900 [Streptomyces hebeiensis]|uniref:Uncharacterized protein n=1 Tax=Streptomyces hebeiensis TaxID=229486 RepID=A0ABN1UKE9_9ACTN